MLSTYRRYGIVVALVLVAGLAGLGVRAQPRAAALPSVTDLVAGSGWQVQELVTSGGFTGESYRQWVLRDTQGHAASLFVALMSVQKMIHWSGELGYIGQGYQVLGHGVQQIRLPGGAMAPVSVVPVTHLADQELLEYATVSPDGIAAHGTDHLLHTAWDVLRGTDGPYFVVSVAVPRYAGNRAAAAIATRLMAPVLASLMHGPAGAGTAV